MASVSGLSGTRLVSGRVFVFDHALAKMHDPQQLAVPSSVVVAGLVPFVDDVDPASGSQHACHRRRVGLKNFTSLCTLR